MSLLVLSASDVDKITQSFTPSDLSTLMAHVFSHLSESSASNPHRTTIPTSHHTALFMPARIAHATPPLLTGTTIKVVCVPTSSIDTRGLPSSTLLLDEITGAVKAIINARTLTALRTAAGSLLSTKLVGPHTPSTLVTFGAGTQIHAHISLHIRAFPSIHTCTIVSRTINPRVLALQYLLQSQFPAVTFTCLTNSYPFSPSADPTVCEPLKQTLLSADTIITATSSQTPLFPSTWVRDGTHIILVGSYSPSMHEVGHEIIRRALPNSLRFPGPPGKNGRLRTLKPMLLVDSRASCAQEAGELIDAGVLPAQMVEIGEVVEFGVAGEVGLCASFSSGSSANGETVDGKLGDDGSKRDGVQHIGEGSREEEGEGTLGPLTIFKSVGIGLQDVAIACLVAERAEEMRSEGKGVGVWVGGYDI